MPTYSLICDACGHKSEIFQPIGKGLPRKCKQCGKHKLRQDYGTPPAFHARLSPMHPRRNRGRGY